MKCGTCHKGWVQLCLHNRRIAKAATRRIFPYIWLHKRTVYLLWDAMDLKQLITIDNDILGGQTVFQGMRVPVESLFDHLEAGISLDGFLEEFPTVSKEQAVGLLEWANKLLNTKNPDRLYAAVT